MHKLSGGLFRYRIKRFLQPRLGQLRQYAPQALNIPDQYHANKPFTGTLPTISIVTPSFNQGAYIERTLQSVLQQNYPNLEYIVQDGASTDSTTDILKQYDSRLKHWESCGDKGQSHAINLGFRHASGEIMAYLNSDDLLLPGSLHYVGEYFANHPEVDVVYGHRILINENEDEIGRWVLPPHSNKILPWVDYVPQETLFWRRRIWEKTGAAIDESFRFAMDWDLLLRFQQAQARFTRLPRFLGAFRVHSQQKTSALINEVGDEEMHRLRMRSHGRKIYPKEIKKHARFYLLKHFFCQKLYKLGILNY
ncbi:glycosyltransferase [Gammaproteobacteria bacterium SCGC AG-212-F23]|nr:glycosyltransferase [Gammaproteobacteria bacterium SCGC AG-212-F23]